MLNSLITSIKNIIGIDVRLDYRHTQPLLFAYIINILMILVVTTNLFDLFLYPYPEEISHIIRNFTYLQSFFFICSLISIMLFRLHYYFTARLIIFFLMLMLSLSMVGLLSNRTDLDLVFLVVLPPLTFLITGNDEKWTRVAFTSLSVLTIASLSLYVIYGEPFLKFDDIFYNNLRSSTATTMLFIGLVFALIQRYSENRRVDLIKAHKETERAKSNLARYFSPKIAEHLQKGAGGFFEPCRQNVALLFTDIKGFTKISETLSAEKVMLMLRSFHALAEPVVFENSGNVENYIGDAMFISFGVPEKGLYDCTNAIATAKGLIKVAADWNKEYGDDYGIVLDIGVGIHYGPAVIGDIGAERTAAFTAIGDSVNVASRLEGLTRKHNCKIVASQNLIKAYCKEQEHPETDFELITHDIEGFRPLEEEQLVKGRSTAIKIWIL